MGIVTIPILLYYFGKSDYSQKSIYEANWGINIPSDLKKIYHNQDKHDFQGKGERYTILETSEIHTLPLIALKNNAYELQTFGGSSYDGRTTQFICTQIQFSKIENTRDLMGSFYLIQTCLRKLKRYPKCYYISIKLKISRKANEQLVVITQSI